MGLLWLTNALTGHPWRFLGDLIGYALAFIIPFGIGWLIRALLDTGPPSIPWMEYFLGLAVVTAVFGFALDRILERPPRDEFTVHATYFPTYIAFAAGVGLAISPLTCLILTGAAVVFVLSVFVYYLVNPTRRISG
ncbi:hypothetical protein KAU45_10700 [bacterium]|nr:hypothetical protein [bacterium]